MLERIFDAEEVYSSGDEFFSISKERFFIIGDLWIVLMKGEELNNRTYNHIAFKIEDGDLGVYEQKIINLGLEIKKDRDRMKGEGLSIYFYDYDNHLFELHTGTLAQRLTTYSKLKEY